MARIAASLTVGIAQPIGQCRFDSVGGISDPVNASTTTADLATLATDRGTFETALATLVADGATPTQAHVTAANNAYTTMKTDLLAVIADLGVGPSVSDVVLSVNATNVQSRSTLRLAVERLLRIMDGNGALTP